MGQLHNGALKHYSKQTMSLNPFPQRIRVGQLYERLYEPNVVTVCNALMSHERSWALVQLCRLFQKLIFDRFYGYFR